MLLALGDCNLLGPQTYKSKTYVTCLGEFLQESCLNCEDTMAIAVYESIAIQLYHFVTQEL